MTLTMIIISNSIIMVIVLFRYPAGTLGVISMFQCVRLIIIMMMVIILFRHPAGTLGCYFGVPVRWFFVAVGNLT